MTTLAILDRGNLQKVAQEGASLKAVNDSLAEKDCRDLLYATADTLYKKELNEHIIGITATAKAGKLDYFIPILQTPWEEGYWKNIHRFEDGRIWFDGVYESTYPTRSSLFKIFTQGVIHNDDKVRTFDEYAWKRTLAWRVAKKLTAAFLQQHLEVALLRTDVHITREYQEEIDYRSSRVEMYFLRVSWG